MCPPYKVLDTDSEVGEEVVNTHTGTTCVHLTWSLIRAFEPIVVAKVNWNEQGPHPVLPSG